MGKKIKIVHISTVMAVITLILGILVIFTMKQSMESVSELQTVSDRYVREQEAISSMSEASDYLTSQAREYVVTGDRKFLDNYFAEVNDTKRRDEALGLLKEYESDSRIIDALESALSYSNELMEIELHAMRMTSEAYGMPEGEADRYFGDMKLSDEEKRLPDDEKKRISLEMMFDDTYSGYKDTIHGEVFDGLAKLIEENSDKRAASYENAEKLLRGNRFLILLMMLAFFVTFIITVVMLILPMSRSVSYIEANEKLPLEGAAEYSYLAETYNNMLEKHMKSQDELSYEASHDSLTGLYNRKLFEEKREELSEGHTALLLVDIDHFKMFNDTYGHDVGDKVLQKVSSALASCFRMEDFPCRIGGDEFAVFMVQMNPELKHVILDKIDRLRKKLEVEDGLPPITLSIGAAFSEEATAEKDLFKIADEALYTSKESEGTTITFYSDLA